MNAPVPSAQHPATAEPQLTANIVQNVDLLLRLADPAGLPPTRTAFAEAVGRDPSNLNKTLKRLEEDGAVANSDDLTAIGLTDFGRRTLQAVDVATGRLTLPHGLVQRRHHQLLGDPRNPRKDWDSDEAVEALDAMRVSILEDINAGGPGIRQLLEIRAGDEPGVDYIVTGERRWRGLGMAIADGDVDSDTPILCRMTDAATHEARLVRALDENLIRLDLSSFDEAKGYADLADVCKWGTDRIAERYGKSRKHVQDRLAALKKLPADDRGRWERGDLGWTEVRGLIQEHKPEPALFGDEGLPKAKAGDPKPAAPAKPPGLQLDDRQALIVAELADRCERLPETDPADYTRVEDTPDTPAAGLLIERGVLAFRSFRGQHFGKVMLHSTGARAWLTERGFYADRDGTLHSLRVAVVGEHKADLARVAALYVTDWLNAPEAVAEPAVEAAPPPAVPAAEAPTVWTPPTSAYDMLAEAPPAARQTYGGLTGDTFSDQLRAIRNEPAAAAQPGRPDPAGPPARDDAGLDMRAAADLAQAIRDHLAPHPYSEHWSDWPPREIAELSLEALQEGDLAEAAALIAALNYLAGQGSAGEVMRSAFAALLAGQGASA